MLKEHLKLLKFSIGGIFWLQGEIFGKSSPPPFDFVPDRDRRGQQKLSPTPIKNLEKKTLVPCLCTEYWKKI